jgi:hypothetical protein
MTEAEWLACGSWWQLSQAAPSRLTRRKFRLFLVACCRPFWVRMSDARCRRALEIAELYADEAASPEDMKAAGAAVVFRNKHSVAYLGHLLCEETAHSGAADLACRLTLEGRGKEWTDWDARREIDAEQADLFREFVGYPFRPITIDCVWLTPTVLSLAQAAYAERTMPVGHIDQARLAVLSDAIEESGCTDAQLLSHLRSPGPHVRGCWALDLILGKE